MKRFQTNRWYFIFTLSALFAILSLGCSSSSDSDANAGDTDSADAEGTIEIFSWWTAPGEADALQALIDVYTEEYPKVALVNVTGTLGDGEDARANLAARMDKNDPPDTFQLGPRDFAKWVEYNGDAADNRLENLDALFETEQWSTLYPQGVLDVLKYNDHYYAVPVNMHRQNSMFYNKSFVAEAEVPTTLEEFFALAETLQADGIVPLAVSAESGWTLDILFQSVMSGSGGAKFHSDFYSGKLDLSVAANKTKLEKALDDYTKVMSYTNVDAGEMGWEPAAKMLFDDEAAMYIHGDWAKGYLKTLGWTPGIDFGAAPAPGSADEFVYNVDAFALCKDAPSRGNALNFLRVIGSAPAQAAFNIIKGSTPVHPDVVTTGWDEIALDTLEHANSASIVHNVEIYQFSIPGATSGASDVGMSEQLLALYKAETTRDELIAWIIANYDAATK